MRGFITGLPRSRTRWFADYFDGMDGVDGYHEPINGMKSKQELYDLIEEGCIISDSGLPMLDGILDKYPDIPVVIIERDIHDVFLSLRAFFKEQGYPMPNWEFMVKQQVALNKIEGLRIPYKQINNRLDVICAHFGIEYDQAYTDTMTVQNLQIPSLTVDVESYLLFDDFKQAAGV